MKVNSADSMILKLFLHAGTILALATSPFMLASATAGEKRASPARWTWSGAPDPGP